jgi:hypothetical protein
MGADLPLDWHIAIVNPVYKGKGNREKPGNYRGISLPTVCDRI